MSFRRLRSCGHGSSTFPSVSPAGVFGCVWIHPVHKFRPNGSRVRTSVLALSALVAGASRKGMVGTSEHGDLPAEAPTRGSLVDRGGRRVGCSAPGDLSGACEAGGR